ncbi:MAG: glycosyltransferase family 2 protein [Candidatus Marinimicrobia bacterium]|nr:glycosyltransferase family 2 protein [Candidatus Neomarinimicrobiota bacterium]
MTDFKEMEDTKIDIIIPTYNGANHIPKLLESIRNQTYSHYNCFVIDDNSKDNTVQIITNRFPWVKLIKQFNNNGPAKNRNIAIRSGYSPYIVIFDDDTYLEDSEWLDKAIKKMEENPNIGQLASMIVSGFDKDILLDCGIIEEDCLFGGICHNQQKKDVSGKYEIPRRVLGACSAGTILRRDVFKKAGGFDPKYFYPVEDLDLSMRIHLTGYDVIYEPSLITYHFESQAMGKTIKRKMYMYRRNCLLALIENYPIDSILKFLALLLAKKLIIPFGSVIIQAVRMKRGVNLSDETKDYLKSAVFLVVNSFDIIMKKKQFNQVRKKPRKYLLEVNQTLKRELSL